MRIVWGLLTFAVFLPSAVFGSLIDQRIAQEESAEKNPFVLTTHKPTYFLPLAFNFDPNKDPFDAEINDVRDAEIKYQFSVKLALWDNIYKGNADFFLAYTQLSYWQAYNPKLSSPFRETNYEPEAFLRFKTNKELFGFTTKIVTFGASHQSNGQFGTLSRSWNRLYMLFMMERGNFYLGLKPWYRLPDIQQRDDNPDIDKYMGYGEVNGVYSWKKMQFGLMLRNNLSSENRGAVELDWSFPLIKKIKGYMQYFDGYGESLIDYNHHNRRLSIGFLLAGLI